MFQTLLKEQEAKLRHFVALQDKVFGLTPIKLENTKQVIQDSGVLNDSEDVIMLANIFVEATKCRTPLIETYAKMIRFLCDLSYEFHEVIKRLLWSQISHAEIQFLVVLLLDNGVFTVDYMLQRVKHTKDMNLSEELIFYFFPEWSQCPEFFEAQVVKHKDKLAKWDLEYTKQCEVKLDGQELAKDNYKQFREYRKRGLNHNALSRSIRLDDIYMLKINVQENDVPVNSNTPRSIFERNKYGKQKNLKLVEYCAFYGAFQCLEWLLSQKAKVTPNIMKFAAHGGNHDVIRLLESYGCGAEGAMLWSLKAYHFSVFKYLYRDRAMAVDYDSLCEMLQYKYKGVYYLLWKGEDLMPILESDPDKKPDESIESKLLVQAAKLNDTFMCRILTQADEESVNTVTSLRYKTAIQAAAASNCLEALQFLVKLPNLDIQKRLVGDSILAVATARNAWECVEELSRTEGVDVNQQSKNRTPLMIACEKGCAAAAKVLLGAANIDVNKKNDDGKSAKYFCEKSGSAICKSFLAPYIQDHASPAKH